MHNRHVLNKWIGSFVLSMLVITFTAANPLTPPTPKTYRIAIIGDSYASGEGNPAIFNQDSAKVVWTQTNTTATLFADCQQCHRSETSGPMQAIQQLQAAEHLIDYLYIPCSGASIVTGSTKGNQLMLPFRAQHHLKAAKLDLKNEAVKKQSQIEVVKKWLDGATLDILIVSIGANDAGFREVVTKVFEGHTPIARKCYKRQKLERKLAANFQRLDMLFADLTRVVKYELAPRHTFITTYANAVMDENGDFCDQFTDKRYDCPTKKNLETGCKIMSKITNKEYQWLYKHLYLPLNQSIRQAAQNAQWHLIDDLTQADTIGFCSPHAWFRTIPESLERQGDVKGAFHLNEQGHQVYGTVLYQHIQSLITNHSSIGYQN